MPLTRHERKDRLPYGAQTRVAELLGIDQSYVSRVVNTERSGVRNDAVERAIAREIGLPVEEVFPPRAASIAAPTQSDPDAPEPLPTA